MSLSQAREVAFRKYKPKRLQVQGRDEGSLSFIQMDVYMDVKGEKRESGCFSKVVCMAGRVELELGTRVSQFWLSRVHWGQFWSVSCSSQVLSDFLLFRNLKV